MALLKILALGNRQIEKTRAVPASEVPLTGQSLLAGEPSWGKMAKL
jgi:hypothetical protein